MDLIGYILKCRKLMEGTWSPNLNALAVLTWATLKYSWKGTAPRFDPTPV